MNIRKIYILKQYGVAIQEGKAVNNTNDVLDAVSELTNETGTQWYVVKAQIHAGEEEKGTIIETDSWSSNC